MTFLENYRLEKKYSCRTVFGQFNISIAPWSVAGLFWRNGADAFPE